MPLAPAPHGVRRLASVLLAGSAALLATLVAAGSPAPAAPAAPAARADAEVVAFPPRPLFWEQPLADPSVVHDGTRWFAAGTGWRGATSSSPQEYGGWVPGPPLLGARPAWAVNGDVWAPEVVRAGDGTWLAYYSVPVAGLPRTDDRCIGVATSPDLATPFTPLQSQPLACPAGAATAAASDVVPAAAALPRRGVIDPSSYVAADGRRFLLYRTQGTPSSIRMVRLTRSGLRAAGPSRELLRDPGVLENPELVDSRGSHVLLMSRGDFGGCGYRTVWRSSTSVRRGWESAPERVLLDRVGTGICGPGGADLVTDLATDPAAGPRSRLVVHGWVCDGVNAPCEATYSSHADPLRRGRRVLYLASLRWTADGPALGRWAQGPAWVPPAAG